MAIRLHVQMDFSHDPDLTPEDKRIASELTEEMMDFIQGLEGLKGIEAVSDVPAWIITSFVESIKRSPDKVGPPELLVEFGVWLGARMRHVKQIS